jgi:acyl-coenzyme A thioesterase PaaI-like protein
MQTDVVSTAADFLGGEPTAEGEWRFSMGRELYGAFGGVFGGAVAAASLTTARSLAPGRVPAALDCRFLRSLPEGAARAMATVVHDGRTLSCVSVDVLDQRERIATRATVSFVDPAVLNPLDHAGASSPVPSWTEVENGARWRQPPGVEAPIIETLEPEVIGRDDRGVATAIRVPWQPGGAGAEAACLAADLCVGPPVAAAFPDRWIPHPNPDLSLRFAAAPQDERVVAAGRLERIAAGLAVVRIEVWSGAELAAAGVSTSLLLPG